MGGFGAFLGKELREIVRTWRIWVLPGIVLFFALSGPPLAKITPELLGTLMAEQQSGVVIQMPDPTYVDAYLQWTKNLSQMVILALIIMFGGIISTETRSGTAILALTKPLSRSAFVLAKLISHTLLLVASVIAGAAVTWALTLAVFGEAPVQPLVEATAVWLVLGLFFVALMELLSAVLDSQAGAAGLGFLVYIVLSVAGLWSKAIEYTPAGLSGAPTDLVIGEPVSLLWPIVTAAALAVLFVAAAVFTFRRREL